MVVIGGKTRWGSKEVVKGGEVDKDREGKDGWRWQGGGSDCGNGCFDNGWRDVLDWDVLVGDVVGDVSSELELHPILLIKQRKEGIKFFLGDADDMGSSFFTKLFKVELGCSTKGFKGGL